MQNNGPVRNPPPSLRGFNQQLVVVQITVALQRLPVRLVMSGNVSEALVFGRSNMWVRAHPFTFLVDWWRATAAVTSLDQTSGHAFEVKSHMAVMMTSISLFPAALHPKLATQCG